MYEVLKHAHSGWRWVVFVTILYAIIHAFGKWKGGQLFTFNDRKPALFALIATHIQLLFGLILYFMSPMVQFSSETMSNSVLRFYSVEHISMMIIGVILITVGFSKGKRKMDTNLAYKNIFWYYLIGLIVILLRTPFPFQDLGAGWF